MSPAVADLRHAEWWPSAASEARGDSAAVVLYAWRGYALRRWLLQCDAWEVDVTGRSMAHVDRLARDWIGHEVGPCADGGRGVTKPPCSCSLARVASRDYPACPIDAWFCAERRARRVVRR